MADAFDPRTRTSQRGGLFAEVCVGIQAVGKRVLRASWAEPAHAVRCGPLETQIGFCCSHGWSCRLSLSARAGHLVRIRTEPGDTTRKNEAVAAASAVEQATRSRTSLLGRRWTRPRQVVRVVAVLGSAALARCVADERTENEGRPPPGEFFAIVHLTDDGIKLPAEMDAGIVSFEVENNGTEPHGFAIEGPGVSERLGTLDPLEREVLTVALVPGTYTVYSPAGDDRRQGLEAEVQVRESVVIETLTEPPRVGPSDARDPIEDEGP